MILLLLLLISVKDSSMVLKACVTNDPSDYDIKARHESKEKADLCITKVNDCKNAELVIYLDGSSENSFYVSSSLDTCK
jgi:hypothetical protein